MLGITSTANCILKHEELHNLVKNTWPEKNWLEMKSWAHGLISSINWLEKLSSLKGAKVLKKISMWLLFPWYRLFKSETCQTEALTDEWLLQWKFGATGTTYSSSQSWTCLHWIARLNNFCESHTGSTMQGHELTSESHRFIHFELITTSRPHGVANSNNMFSFEAVFNIRWSHYIPTTL